MYRIISNYQTTRSERDDKLAGSARINRRLASAGSLRSAALEGSNGKLLRKKEEHYVSSRLFCKISFWQESQQKDSSRRRHRERSRGHLGNQGNLPRAEAAIKLFFFPPDTYYEATVKSRHKKEVIKITVIQVRALLKNVCVQQNWTN